MNLRLKNLLFLKHIYTTGTHVTPLETLNIDRPNIAFIMTDHEATTEFPADWSVTVIINAMLGLYIFNVFSGTSCIYFLTITTVSIGYHNLIF